MTVIECHDESQLQELILVFDLLIVMMTDENDVRCEALYQNYGWLSDILHKRSAFAAVDMNEVPELIDEFQLDYLPYFIVFKDQTIVDEIDTDNFQVLQQFVAKAITT